MKFDPRFPDRPTHPDFDRLCRAVVTNDESIEKAPDVGAAWEEVLSEFIDREALVYVIRQRMLRVEERDTNRTSDDKAAAWFHAAWIDGFMAAARMFRPGVGDGQHR